MNEWLDLLLSKFWYLVPVILMGLTGFTICVLGFLHTPKSLQAVRRRVVLKAFRAAREADRRRLISSGDILRFIPDMPLLTLVNCLTAMKADGIMKYSTFTGWMENTDTK